MYTTAVTLLCGGIIAGHHLDYSDRCLLQKNVRSVYKLTRWFIVVYEKPSGLKKYGCKLARTQKRQTNTQLIIDYFTGVVFFIN